MFSYAIKAPHRKWTKRTYFARVDLRRNLRNILKTLGNWPKAMKSQKGLVRQLEMISGKLHGIGYDRKTGTSLRKTI